MSGRKGKGGGRVQRSPPPHLRLVEPDDDAALAPGYAQPIIQRVVINLLRDADHITDAALYAVVDAIIGHGFELYPEQALALRKTIFDMVAGALRARLLAGLSDTDIGVSDGRTRVDDDGSRIIDKAEHILDAPPPQGLMERFRAALAEDDA